MMKIYVVKKGQKPTEEQIRKIQEAAKHPITFDEDCEELSPAMLKAFRCVAAQRNRNRKVLRNSKYKVHSGGRVRYGYMQTLKGI